LNQFDVEPIRQALILYEQRHFSKAVKLFEGGLKAWRSLSPRRRM
jgi:hypothetical protein